jgi:multimeric flavodoxin WrbA
MKVLGINGSARKDGNTAILIRAAFRELEAAGIETELVQLAEMKIKGCAACYLCGKNLNQRCAIEDDDVNGIIKKMQAADGFILGSPTYFSDITSEMKALIDRTGFVAKMNGGMFARKVGAGAVAVRRGGAIHAFDTINHFFLISEMIIPGSIYWNIGYGRERGDVESDEEGMRTMTMVGKNMAWLLKKIQG